MFLFFLSFIVYFRYKQIVVAYIFFNDLSVDLPSVLSIHMPGSRQKNVLIITHHKISKNKQDYVDFFTPPPF